MNKNCAQEIRQVKVPQLALPPTVTSPNWHLPKLALPPTGNSPNRPSPQAKIPQLPVHRAPGHRVPHPGALEICLFRAEFFIQRIASHNVHRGHFLDILMPNLNWYQIEVF